MAVEVAKVKPGPNGEKDPADYAGLDRPDYLRSVGLDPKTGRAAVDPFAWFAEFEMTDEEAIALSEAKFVVDDMIIEGHMQAVCAKGNSGKSSIMVSLCPGMVERGYTVAYVHCDCPPDEGRRLRELSIRHKYRLLTPDFKSTGVGADDVVGHLRRMNASGADLSGAVFIFDTLKKFTDLMSKRGAADFLKLLRALTSKGATIILLGHTNKNVGLDGKEVFEGVGDLRNDVDELVYLDAMETEDGSLTVTTRPDKRRGNIKPVSFKIHKNREVERIDDTVDVQSVLRASAEVETEQTVIDACSAAMRAKKVTATEIIGWIKESPDYSGIGDRRIRRVLKRFAREPMRQWHEQSGVAHNVLNYSLEPFGRTGVQN